MFRTKSDTEALLRHVTEHGPAGLAALSGMFAFALWDDRQQSLLLARDRAGIKPLYYGELPDGGVAFASELASLMAHPAVNRTMSQEGLVSYFFSDYVQPPHTMIAGAKKLRPGHYIVWKDGVLSEQTPFWSVPLPRARGRIASDRSRAGKRALEQARQRRRTSARGRRPGRDLPERWARLLRGGNARASTHRAGDEGVLDCLR